MRLITTILFLLVVNVCWGNNFYLSSSTGSDSNPGTISQPWASLAKLNASFGSINAGDSILLKCGDTFYGSIIIPKSGTSGNNIIIASYGIGAKPVISGATSLTSWTSTGSNKWRASCTQDSTLVVLTQNGQLKAFAKDTTQNGWRRYTYMAPQAISFYHTTNLVGKTLIMKPNDWSMERNIIVTDNGVTVTYRRWFALNNGQIYPYETPISGFGCYLSNDTSYLNEAGEWVWDYTGQYVYVYSATTPTNIKVSTVDTLINIGFHSFITVKNIALEYGNLYGIYAIQAQGLLIENNDFSFMGAQAFGCYRLYNSTLQNNTFTDCLSICIYNQSISSPYINVNILNNRTKRNGLFYGMGSWSINQDYSALGIGSYNGLNAKYNVLDSIGDAGIKWGGSNVDIYANKITNYNLRTADRGAIYTYWNQSAPNTEYYFNRKIHNCFTDSSYGDINGTPNQNSANPTYRSNGIYNDGVNSHVTMDSCTLSGIARSAINNNADSDMVSTNNIIVLGENARYANSRGVGMQQQQNYVLANTNIQNNIIYSSVSTQSQIYFTAAATSQATIGGNFKTIGTLNNNYYTLPTIANYGLNAGTPYWVGSYNHANWTANFGFGVNDVSLPSYPLSQTLFLKNYSNHDSIFTLNKAWIDAKGQVYTGSITVPAYYSALLFPTTVTPVVVTIDSNPVITLPTNSTTLSGSATGGTITSYLWRKKSGGSATITTPNSNVTTITGLSAGTYVFTLKATNNLSQTDSAFATVTVNPSATPPVVTINPNSLQVTLPTSSVVLSGSATAGAGRTIVSYQWTKISGTGSTIVSPTSATTTVTGLTTGTSSSVYIYSLTATDNLGSTGSATVQVQVNPQPITTGVRGRFRN